VAISTASQRLAVDQLLIRRKAGALVLIGKRFELDRIGIAHRAQRRIRQRVHVTRVEAAHVSQTNHADTNFVHDEMPSRKKRTSEPPTKIGDSWVKSILDPKKAGFATKIDEKRGIASRSVVGQLAALFKSSRTTGLRRLVQNG